MAVGDVFTLWEQLDKLAHPYLTPIENDAQYQDALTFLEALWDKVGEDPTSPYGTLLRIVSEHISVYESAHYSIPDAPPHHVLAFLMEQHALTQKDVEEATGLYQSNLSKILKGERKLTTEQIKTLATHFGVNPMVLL